MTVKRIYSPSSDMTLSLYVHADLCTVYSGSATLRNINTKGTQVRWGYVPIL